MSKELIISPISIDLGAKNTGVYFAHYPAGSSIEDIEKEGKVYQLEKDKYTLLMTNRTAARHQRRGFDRRQMVKRLFRLIWCEYFGLEWDKNVQQTTSFLFNRRGFSFLTEEYDAEILSRFPEEAYKLLPKELQFDSNNNVEYDFASALTEWANEGKEKTRSMFNTIDKEPKRIRHRLFFISKTKKLREYCHARMDDQKIPEEKKADLSRLSKWILEEWHKKCVQGLPVIPSDNIIDMVAYLNEQDINTAQQILNSLSSVNFSEETKLNESNWNFRSEKLDLEKVKFDPIDKPEEGTNIIGREKYKKDHREWLKTHLHHLAFALYQINNEIESGGRHRSKYFEEVKTVLKNQYHTHRYLKEFCGKLQSDRFEPFTVKTLTNLIGHLSNLELKPLRKYFNDEKHKNGDYWDEDRLNKIFDRWILREWRINPEKDTNKIEGKEGDYKKLCEKWKNHQSTVVDFWLATNPFSTIPPYQDNNNRRPPRCQSLVLNPTFLDKNYGKWQGWLGELKKLRTVQRHLGDFENQLEGLKGGKGKSYFSHKAEGKLKKALGHRTHKDLNARILQFIFDRVKADDPLNLNEIYSHAKKYRQLQSTEQERKDAKNKLGKAIGSSELPDTLETPIDYQSGALFLPSSFLHLVCKYYKIRQKARDGRIFIHPVYRYIKDRGYENTGRFDDKDHLLTYCNHKPRQKRYQMLGDLAGLLQVTPGQLEDFVEKQHGKTIDEKLFNWLNGIDNLKTNCDRAAKEQKDRRGRLKLDIQKIFGLVYHRRQSESPSAREIKEILRNSKVSEASKLHSFCERAKSLCLIVTQSLYNTSRQQQWQQDLDNNPAAAVYLLAQVNDLAFKERNGNANTCAVCGTDNAQRMQMVAGESGGESHAKAQRLPAIETRLIDGAVMRMARIAGGAIAEDKWQKIKLELEKGNQVHIPIITESNRFEFEPNLKALKGKKSDEKGTPDNIFDERKERIKLAGNGISPYSGELLGDSGDLDHIIPRSHENWGTLNDETNLIFTSEQDNRNRKGNEEYSLENLRENYKQAQFGSADAQDIERWIIDQIGAGEGENFKFGPYRSFINLTPEQQTAFRHALFLVGHPLREKVIKAMDNRTRTLVNGTQRYFAQLLANSFYKEAKAINKQHLLSFDYFGVEAQSNTRGNGIKDLRNDFEKTNHEVFEYAKHAEEKQKAYSHLIDAQLAFAMVADAHKNDGSLKLQIRDSISLRPVDIDTGEMLENTIFGAIQVKPEEMQRKKLERRKAYTVETHHREMIAKNKKPAINYQIHRDSIFKENFFPILKFKDETFKKGFNQSNCVNFNANQFSLLLKNNFIRQTSKNDQYEVWNILKKTCQQFLMKIGVVGASEQEIKIAKIIDKLTYQTIKKPLGKVLDTSALKNKPPITVGEALQRWNKCIKEEDFKKDGILLPAYYEWQKLYQGLLEESKESNFHDFVKNCSLFRINQSVNGHNKVRKVFSLPVKSNVGSIRLQRKSWDKTSTIQVVAEESLGKYGYEGKSRPHTIISKHSVPRKHYTGIPDSWYVEPLEWKEVPVEEIKVLGGEGDQGNGKIIDAKIINQDADRCMVRLTISSIQNLSLPQDKSHWKGKVFCYENAEKLKEVQEKDKNRNHHCLLSQWRWFEKPFALPNDRREVEIETNSDGKVITFTVSKSSKLKSWLLS